MRILLIEDDKLIGDGIKAGLTKLGFNLDWFTDGVVGKNALDSAPYDAVILDLSLPGLDGLDLLRQWRQAGQDVPGPDPPPATRWSSESAGCKAAPTIICASRSRWPKWRRACRR